MTKAIDQVSEEQSFLGDVFDNYQNMMQIARCVREAGRQRGVGAPRILELSRQATNVGEYLPEATITRYVTHDENEEPILTSPVTIPFPGKSFDVCFVTDIYEHIPIDQRPELLREMFRVTSGLSLVGTPVETEIVTRADRLIFDFIWGKHGVRFNPLKQHVEYGLEPLETVVDHFKSLGASRVVALPDNYVYRWIHQILIFFDLQYDNPLGRELYEPVNRVYNEYIGGKYDYREPCYRYLLAVTLDPRINLDQFEANMKAPPETPESLKQAEGALVEAFRTADARAVEELKARLKEIAQLRHELWLRDNEIARLKAKRSVLERMKAFFSA